MEINISNKVIEEAASQGFDEFLAVIRRAMTDRVGSELNAACLQSLNEEQITLWGYLILRDELMDGGFVQLIHNGYGPFFFNNPFAKAMRMWGLADLSNLLNKAKKLYGIYKEELTKDCSEEEFMALFEQFPKFDELDDKFVENEEETTAAVAYYVDEHLTNFVNVIQE